MAEARKDLNFVSTLLGTSNADDSTPIRVYADPTTRRLFVNSAGTVEETGHAALGGLVTTVTTAGTAVQLASNAAKRVIIQALSYNEDAVQIGISNVVATPVTQQTGFRLFPTQALTLVIDNTNLIYVDASVNGDGISVVFEN